MQRLDRGDLLVGQALIAALARGAAQRCRLELRLAADGILHQRVFHAVGLVACLQNRIRNQLDLGGADPAVAHRRQPRARSGMLQANPVDDGHAGKDAVKIVRIALRHGQPLAAAFGRSHEVQLCRRIAVGAHHHRNSGVAHLLVGFVRKILERFVIERKGLRRLALLGLMAGIGAIGDKAPRERRRRAKGLGRRQRKAGDEHAVKTAAAILQRAAVPLERKIDLEADRRRLGISRFDAADHLAEFGHRRRDARGRRRPALGDRQRRRRLHRGGVDPHGVLHRPGKAAAGGRGIALDFGCRLGG